MSDSKVVSIEENLPHNVAELICVKCLHRGLCVWPERTYMRDLECPGCGQSGYLINTGEEIHG